MMNKFGLFTVAVLLVGCGNEGDLVSERNKAGVGQPPPDINPVQEDRIIQIQQPQVDILFVVDNSCSMYEEQQLLGSNFPGFMSYFLGSGLDYHIGVTSTDVENQSEAGKLRRVSGVRYIEESTNNPAGVFTSMANMGTNGSYTEQGRSAAYSLLEIKRDLPRNHGFYREDASLHLVFISDEEDQSVGQPTRGEFRNWMLNLKRSPDMVSSHSIVGIPGQSCAAIDTAGSNYIFYSTVTNGIVFNLCEPNWGPLLNELGLQTSGLKTEYFLSKIPVISPWSLDVKVVLTTELGQNVTLTFTSCLAGEEMDDPECDVVYNPGVNSISFLDYIPDPRSEVFVKYNIRELFQASDEF